MLTRRQFAGVSLGAVVSLGALSSLTGVRTANAAFPYSKTDAEWRKLLTPAQYRVLREEGTERAGSSPLDHEKRAGTFHCAGCDQALFASKTKYDSGTGWPSFYAPLPGAVGTKPDPGIFGTRTEVHCSNCGGHLGHVFDDGPAPTGKRYCMNGIAMTFQAA
ncbi:peptide-methionine (R)-S-oxide reductase MsrB [Microbaculum marinum]|uniref:peptide-methionine (R)-S-oxide reductase n=1 Tax=Microbaculum marinum TaxID=1764581 RepID=A0AAW9RLE5_9HYPH